MKTFLLLFTVIPFLATSQITVTASDFANTGDTVRMSKTTDFTIDFSSTGANYSWDYSALTATDQELRQFTDASSASILVQVLFGMFAPTEYQASYFLPGTALPLDQIGGALPVNIESVYQFTRKTNDSITSIGYSMTIEGTEVPIKSDTIETRYKFPLNYNDTYASRGYTKLDMNPIYNGIWIQYRQRNSVVDGWGSIITPYGTFNALRIDHTITETDSLYIDAFGTGFWLPIPLPDSHIYEWWTNGEKDAILRITTSDIAGTEVVSDVEYRDYYLGLDAGIEELEGAFKVYPNPATNQLNIEAEQQGANYQITSMDGKEVLVGELNAATNKLNISALQPGAYVIHFALNGKTMNTSFIKK